MQDDESVAERTGTGGARALPGVRDIRWLRETADFLDGNADRHRAVLIARQGLKRYVYNALSEAAHAPAAGCRLMWADDVEVVESDVSLGKVLLQEAREGRGLPQAVVTREGRKYYL